MSVPQDKATATAKEVLFPKGLSREENNRRRQAYLKEWRKGRPGWNKCYALDYYRKNKDVISAKRKAARKTKRDQVRSA